MFAMAQRAKVADENDGVYIHLLQHMLGLNGRIDEYDEYFAPVALEIMDELQAALRVSQSQASSTALVYVMTLGIVILVSSWQLDPSSCSPVLFAAPPSRNSSRYMSATFPVDCLIPIVSNLLSHCPVFSHCFLDNFCSKAEIYKRGWSRDGRVELQVSS
eukprot:gb/GECG01002833.1/.p1 GENE.gb/GECG01002833.1/~~gb/GECG01002833.1/.p1  ORF type:complete len:160 (+),score=17.85 gb/GECG01002833.1/:1-480(+)